MVITATKFKANIGQYLDFVAEKKVFYITKNGKIVAQLSHPAHEPSILDALVGIIPQNHMSLEEAKMERIMRRAYPELRKDNSQ